MSASMAPSKSPRMFSMAMKVGLERTPKSEKSEVAAAISP